MATRQNSTPTESDLNPETLEGTEEVVEHLLEGGDAYQNIRRIRDLDKSYDELTLEEKWDVALDVIQNRTGEVYEDFESLLNDLDSGELELDYLRSWTDSYEVEIDGETVERDVVTEEVDEGEVKVYVKGREDEGIHASVPYTIHF